jgi:hypothetical protein
VEPSLTLDVKVALQLATQGVLVEVVVEGKVQPAGDPGTALPPGVVSQDISSSATELICAAPTFLIMKLTA